MTGWTIFSLQQSTYSCQCQGEVILLFGESHQFLFQVFKFFNHFLRFLHSKSQFLLLGLQLIFLTSHVEQWLNLRAHR